MNSPFQNQRRDGTQPSSFKSKIDTAAVMADGISQLVLQFLRTGMGYSAIRTAFLTVFALVVIFGPEIFDSILPFGLAGTQNGGISPLGWLAIVGAALGFWQRHQSWKQLSAGVLNNPYSRGTSRLQPFLHNIRNGQGQPYFSEDFIQRWIEPFVVFVSGWILVKLGIGGGLGPYLMLSGLCLRGVEQYVYLKNREVFLQGVAALAQAEQQAAIAQRFQTRSASGPANNTPVSSLPTGVGSDLASKVAELKAQSKKEPM